MPDEATEARVWRQALKRLLVIEAAWPRSAARQRALLACRRWMEAQTEQPRLCRLARLLVPAMDPAQFASVLVPVERETARRRITDVQILDRDFPAEAAVAERMPLTLVADSLRSAFNIGGLFRTAECFGAEGLWLCGYSATPEHPQVAEAALGADRLVPWRMADRIGAAIAELRQAGHRIVALETVADAVELAAFQWPFPCGLLLGNERFGLDPTCVRDADVCVQIPVFGRKNSLNVVSAAAVALYDARCAWTRKHNGAPADRELDGTKGRMA